MSKTILVIAAHPDDELLGVGGTIIKHTDKGDKIYSVIMCEGESLRYKRNVGQNEAIKQAAEILGVSHVYQLGFPDEKLDTYSLVDLINPLIEISNEINPNIIYCQFGGDINQDHKILFNAANIAFRPLDDWIEDFMCFYTVSSTEWAFPRTFTPDTWVDISDVLERKIDAFQCYHSEIREYPHPRSSEALRYAAHYFGNQCFMDAAEVFMSIRRIKR